MKLAISYNENIKDFLEKVEGSIKIPKDLQDIEFEMKRKTIAFSKVTHIVELIGATTMWLYHISKEKHIIVLYHTRGSIFPITIEFSNFLSYESLNLQIIEQVEQIQEMNEKEIVEFQNNNLSGISPIIIGETYYDLQDKDTLQFVFSKNVQSVEMIFNSVNWKENTIIRYAQQIKGILIDALQNTSERVSNFNIITEAEVALYNQVNDTIEVYPEKSIVDMFYKTVTQFSNRIALSSKEGTLTYEELNKKSNQIAHMLIKSGVQSGDYVGIFMKRSLDTVVSMVAILKAGAAYVPIDPDYPENRIQYIIQDSQAKVILMKETPIIFEGVQTASIYDSETYEVTDVKLPIHCDDMAYMIYTSGSTGNPKGTMLAHRGVTNLCTWMQRQYELTEEDVFAQFPSFSFDASVWESFASLFCGGNLYVLLEEERLSVEAFANAIHRGKVTSILALATIFVRQIATYLTDEEIYKLASLKRIAIGGEMLPVEVIKLWRERIGTNVEIHNVYGPTECTVVTTTYRIPSQLNEEVASIPIGKPCANYQVMILDENMNLCPIGVPGELYIDSVGLAKGYFNKPEKTFEAFVPNPLNPIVKIYKTGDIVRLLEDGNIEFLHRKDDQVKIRGHRIELGEIQSKISQNHNIKENAVFAKKSKEGSQYLIAFYTTLNKKEIPELVYQLQEQLPDYMVPSKLIYINELPLTPNKKIDVKKLAQLEEKYEPVRLQEYVTPSTEAEKKIAHAWAEVLGISKIGVHDDFFTIGGHSLKVLRVLTLLKEDFSHLTIQDFFKERTIYGLARLEREVKVEVEEVFREYKVIHEPDNITYTNVMKDKQISNVFLTGATGYLGSHILYELLRDTSATIYCLVRPTKDVQQRIIDTLASYFNDICEEWLQRIQAVPGDLGEEYLGMSEEEFMLIRSKIDTVIHCGADVRHFGDVKQFENVNVQGTSRMLALAENGATFHFISTIGIPIELAMEQWDTYVEIGDFNYDVELENVYSNSKLQAENLVREAIKCGVSGNIYRAGNLACHSETGSFQQNIEGNAFYRLIKTMLLIGKAPSVKWKVDFTPIDFASKSIVSYLQDPQIVGETLHICHPHQVEFEHFIQLIEECGYDLEMVPLSQYVDTGLELAKGNEVIAELIASQVAGDGAQQSEIVMGTRRTNKWINEKKLSVPAIDKQFIQKLLSHGEKVGYFPKVIK
ncbi:amino acid adenylation domain-containing protein [Bacillus paramycoides]|uniref:non-ribosomal peptide synthetase n=1 Tax=Bacillus paramycoides TaxID=2026194 RepID=UPI00224336EA|nr:non-ribosomal peptide synthetase [Bacillus paramycoides]MCW9133456.1 amino acid adenylation domain-containing protein [Bacillus paramycoides]